MSWAPTHKLALACGVAGAMVEVTKYVVIDQGHLTNSYGVQQPMVDPAPGKFSFPLNNADGRFAPDNTAILTTPLTEGMAVSWTTDTRVVYGKISGITPAWADIGDPTTSRMVITVTDSLGSLARNTLAALTDEINQAATQNFMYALGDASGAAVAVESNGGGLGSLVPGQVSATPGTYAPCAFGTAQPAWLPDTMGTIQAQFVGGGADTSWLASPKQLGAANYQYAAGSAGFYNLWYQNVAVPLGSASNNGQSMVVFLNGLTAPFMLTVGPTSSVSGMMVTIRAGATGAFGQTTNGNGAAGSWPIPDTLSLFPHFVSMGITGVFAAGSWTLTATAYFDGVAVATSPYSDTVLGTAIPTFTTANKQPSWVGVQIIQAGAAAFGPSMVNVSRFSHTMSLPHEEYAALTTEAGRLQAIAATTPDVTFGALPAALSSAPIGFSDTTGKSAMDLVNDVLRTEQGKCYCTTTGTLLAPSQSVTFRERTRPPTVSAQFACATDIVDTPQFLRDVSNTISSAAVTGVGNSVTVTDPTMVLKVGSASSTLAVLNTQTSDLIGAGQDRIIRGKKSFLDVISFQVEGMVGTDRSADLLALTLGNRYQVTGIPNAQLAFGTWDGFLIGVVEDHTSTSSLFTLFFEPAGARTAIFDTDEFMAGTDLSLSASCTAIAATISVATVGAKLETVAVPYTILVDAEQMIVTACTGATPQVASVTRGANSTAAAAHSSGASVELAASSQFAY